MTDHEDTNQPADAAAEAAATDHDNPTIEQLDAALLTLRRLDRELFLAHRLDQMSYRQMADITGLSLKQVRKRMARAMYDFDRALSGQPRRRRRWWWPF